MPEVATVHKIVPTVPNPVVLVPILTNIIGYLMKSYLKTMIFVNKNHLARHCIGLSGMKFTDDEILELAERIKTMKATGTHLCCSIGFLTEKQARILKDAGLDRINHNLNTSRSYYSHICSTHTLTNVLTTLKCSKVSVLKYVVVA